MWQGAWIQVKNYGEIRALPDGTYVLRLNYCEHSERLNDDQFHGRVSVNHSLTGCQSALHIQHNFAAAIEENELFSKEK